MRTRNFTIIASGLDTSSDDFADRLFEAGCGDATVTVQKGLIVLEFDRVARNFARALVSAVHDVMRAGAHIERVEPDYLVSASDIAARSGMSRSAISLYASQSRGKGFPRPVARMMTETPLWDWFEVASWMHKQRRISLESVVQAKLVREVNRVVADEPSASPFRMTTAKQVIFRRLELA